MQKAQDAGYIGMAGVEPEFIAMKYDENGHPVKAIDTDPIKGIRPRRQAFGYDVEHSLDSMHFLKELIDILNGLGSMQMLRGERGSPNHQIVTSGTVPSRLGSRRERG